MLILSVGMPRAGSGWFYNLMHDLVVANGGSDARAIRSRFHLAGIWSEVNCNIGVLSLRRLVLSSIPAMLGYTYVIKAHAAPSFSARLLLRWGWMRAAYIYRDPRDAMLSAYENGQQAREKGHQNAFSELVDFEHALAFMQRYVHISQEWLNLNPVLSVRYEDLLSDYDNQVERLCEFLKIDPRSEATKNVINRYRPAQSANIREVTHELAAQKGLHFRKGISGRYRQKFNHREQHILNQTFADYLRKQNYPIEENIDENR